MFSDGMCARVWYECVIIRRLEYLFVGKYSKIQGSGSLPCCWVGIGAEFIQLPFFDKRSVCALSPKARLDSNFDPGVLT